ncbi:BPTI/Kunitz domain-containing protein-like [Hyposmocoma kahamanoa]|uniref:BPTI/Kunitz domain-containing protein-like n=1 Tax=Hyposmocoma kahamanoa TaxID=1477025 RepID=UPI000E6DA31D|nr:BPTI/Kunitz domain-containing protein-like [Hyposmocoma kahamanoa]
MYLEMERLICTLLILCLVLVNISVCSGEDDVTTTSQDYVYRPTATSRNGLKWIEYTPASPLDLFKLAGHAISRRSESEIWNWDIWCQLQAIPGNCTKQIARYYYDSQLDQCQTFTYSGCGGNKNKFDSILNCERHCKGASYMRIREGEKIGNTCKLQPSSGLCMAFIEKYYFDLNTHTCKEFTYGGCGGNKNRFNTLEDCELQCKHSATSAEQTETFDE